MPKTSTNTPTSNNKKKKNPKGTSISTTTGKNRDKSNNYNSNNHVGSTSSNRTIPRNDNGGILITDEEIDRAFNFFDIDGTNQITSSNLRDRLSIFSAAPPKPNEIRFLLNSKPHLTKTELRDLIKENNSSSDSKNFDPYKEAFSWFDPLNTGYIDLNILKRTFSKLGFGDTMEEDELLVLLEIADQDKDGKFSLLDFQNMLSSSCSNLTETTITTTAPAPASSPTNEPITTTIKEDDINDGGMKDNDDNNNDSNNQAIANDESPSES